MRLRDATAEDAEAHLAIYGRFIQKTSITFETELPSAADFAKRIELTSARYPWIVAVDDDDRVAGYAYACEHRARRAYSWVCEVSVYVSPEHHKRGVARRLYACLFNLLRQSGRVRVYAGVTLPNAASVGFHESMGFKPFAVYEQIGFKFGAWHDVGWWQLLLDDLPASPTEPMHASRLRDTPAWQATLERASTS